MIRPCSAALPIYQLKYRFQVASLQGKKTGFINQTPTIHPHLKGEESSNYRRDACPTFLVVIVIQGWIPISMGMTEEGARMTPVKQGFTEKV